MSPAESAQVIRALHRAVEFLIENPYPHVPTPEGCKKRASVAIIIRMRPAFEPVPAPASDSQTVDDGSASRDTLAASEVIVDPDNHHDEKASRPVKPQSQPPATLAEFFHQDWVSKSDPEVLFIKRASHHGDRWSGHIALPGGKRDPEDATDLAAAIREAREEVGIELSNPSTCLYAGSLPERVVAQTWGNQALMVLCPYIFILTEKDGGAGTRARPQPTEVAAAHWVPLRALLNPALRTREYVDTASRMAAKGGWFAQRLLRLMIGRMCFSAIRLAPSESIHSSSTPGFLPSPAEKETRVQSFMEGAFGVVPPLKKMGLTYQQDLLLWGLTLGVMADFLDMLPPYNAVRLWMYPTFTVPDLRFIVWAVTRGLRKGNAGDLSAGTWGRDLEKEVKGGEVHGNSTAIDDQVVAAPVAEANRKKQGRCRKNDVGISGLGLGSDPAKKDSVSRLLTGYYERISVSIVAFLLYRTALTGWAGWWIWKQVLQKRFLGRA